MVRSRVRRRQEDLPEDLVEVKMVKTSVRRFEEVKYSFIVTSTWDRKSKNKLVAVACFLKSANMTEFLERRNLFCKLEEGGGPPPPPRIRLINSRDYQVKIAAHGAGGRR
jgi:hypothetical protein